MNYKHFEEHELCCSDSDEEFLVQKVDQYTQFVEVSAAVCGSSENKIFLSFEVI